MGNQLKDVQLSEKLSDLIELAIIDLEKCEKNPLYRIDMRFWHSIYFEGEKELCVVCFAGAVMSQTFNSPINLNLSPGEFNQSYIFYCLEIVRIGAIGKALLHFLQGPYGEERRTIAEVIDRNATNLNKMLAGQTAEHYDLLREILNWKLIHWYVDIPKYKENPNEFKNRLKECAAMLREFGF